jgi:hypothetical protein
MVNSDYWGRGDYWVGLDLKEMDEIIDGNITITDSRLRDGVYGVVLDTMTTLMEKNNVDDWEEKESADVKAMGEAQIVLQAIKDADPGTYDEMIDNALRLIAQALSIGGEHEQVNP